MIKKKCDERKKLEALNARHAPQNAQQNLGQSSAERQITRNTEPNCLNVPRRKGLSLFKTKVRTIAQ